MANKRELSLDTEAIAQAEALDGYYVITTSETNWSDEKILDTYRELWRIEETFKVTKSELQTRPVFVWTNAHIEAHFLTCYIALVILRLLQLRCGLSCAQIREEIAGLMCTKLDANWWLCGHRNRTSDVLIRSLGLEELKLKNIRTTDMTEITAKAKKFEIEAGLPHKK